MDSILSIILLHAYTLDISRSGYLRNIVATYLDKILLVISLQTCNPDISRQDFICSNVADLHFLHVSAGFQLRDDPTGYHHV
jgi:hypothetical protein